MLKKLLILPILGSILGFGAFASADTVSDIASCFSYDANYGSNYCMGNRDYAYSPNIDTNSCIINLGYTSSSVNSFVSRATASNSCNMPATSLADISQYLNLLESSTPPTPPIDSDPDTPDDPDSSLGIPEIPSSFTSGLTSLVNNFGGTIVNWLPTIILVALGIYAIFSLFRVVRNYARSSFNG